jgi:hypothetical protein
MKCFRHGGAKVSNRDDSATPWPSRKAKKCLQLLVKASRAENCGSSEVCPPRSLCSACRIFNGAIELP